MDIPLKYGCNPNQGFARVVLPGEAGPLAVLNGSPSYINVLDGLRGWQLVRDLKSSTGKAAAASYKHVSPAGAAVAGPLSDALRRAMFVDDAAELSPVAAAYVKARSSDRSASFGDFIAVSEPVDVSLAQVIKPEVSDGIIAPAYDEAALKLLAGKKRGNYVVLRMDASYEPPRTESRMEFGLMLEQSHNDAMVTRELFIENIATKNATLSDEAIETLIVATVTLKHTQSNSIVVAYESHAIGVGAGQQSRIACTRLACDKADRWFCKLHPRALGLEFAEDLPRSERVNAVDQFVRYDELDERERALLHEAVRGELEPIGADERREWIESFQGVALSSDAFIPFRDNIDRAARSGVKYVAQAGGSARDADVIAAADEHGMVMAMTGLRLFLH